jgi:hypothetical protein
MRNALADLRIFDKGQSHNWPCADSLRQLASATPEQIQVTDNAITLLQSPTLAITNAITNLQTYYPPATDPPASDSFDAIMAEKDDVMKKDIWLLTEKVTTGSLLKHFVHCEQHNGSVLKNMEEILIRPCNLGYYLSVDHVGHIIDANYIFQNETNDPLERTLGASVLLSVGHKIAMVDPSLTAIRVTMCHNSVSMKSYAFGYEHVGGGHWHDSIRHDMCTPPLTTEGLQKLPMVWRTPVAKETVVWCPYRSEWPQDPLHPSTPFWWNKARDGMPNTVADFWTDATNDGMRRFLKLSCRQEETSADVDLFAYPQRSW